jgi:hypothetical protein
MLLATDMGPGCCQGLGTGVAVGAWMAQRRSALIKGLPA